MYCLLYKQVQSESYHNGHSPVWHSKKVSDLEWNLLKMMQKNARLGFCEVQTS